VFPDGADFNIVFDIQQAILETNLSKEPITLILCQMVLVSITKGE